MRLRIQFATALVCTAAVIATDRSASAQSQQTGIVRNGAGPAPQNAAIEELPAGQMPAGQMSDGSQPHEYYPSGPADSGFSPNGYYPGGGADGYCGDNCCQPSCGAPGGCSEPCCDSGGGCGSGGRFFFTADYLYVHSSFSEATAFIAQDLGAGTDYVVPLDFGYQSSYRLGGGYRLCSCGEEIRFMVTRMTDDASAVAFPGDIVPFDAAPPPDGHTNIRANVNAKAYDLECAKTIPLGGQRGGCGDACGDGCGDACGKSCPAWDITWSGGVRWADVDWNRSYVALDDTDFPVTDVRSGMAFHGGGIRAGLEGRRYFFCDGWLSIYGKGNLSLLLGDVNIHTTRSSDDGNTVVSQTFVNRQLIPVTELEAGLTAQVTCHTAFTAGYLMTAWHDLGFRNAFDVCDCGNANPAALLPARFDDANILGFDGFFARLEWAY